VEQVVTTAQTTVVNRVQKRSRAVWAPADSKVLNNHAYNSDSPKVVTLEVVGTVFFGSALHLLNLITDEIGLVENSFDFTSPMSPRTPHTSSSILTKSPSFHTKSHKKVKTRPPKYLVLDLRGMSNLDASATRGCFLQLVKMCTKRGIIITASGASQRIEWMLRSHDVSMSDLDEEQSLKGKLLSPEDRDDAKQSLEKILLFVTVQEALEFCETSVIQFSNNPKRSVSLSQIAGLEEQSISNVLAYILGSSEEETKILSRLEDKRYHDEVEVKSNDAVFHKNAYADAFYIVLNGCVAHQTSTLPTSDRAKPVVSGAGFVRQKRVGSSSDLFDKKFLEEQKKSADSTVITWRAGGVFGYFDYLMDRRRAYQALSTQDGTKLAKFSHSHMNLLQEDPALYALVQKVLLHASTLDLANCTCRDV
jgi:anti-anti-sigma regulatory factor